MRGCFLFKCSPRFYTSFWLFFQKRYEEATCFLGPNGTRRNVLILGRVKVELEHLELLLVLYSVEFWMWCISHHFIAFVDLLESNFLQTTLVILRFRATPTNCVKSFLILLSILKEELEKEKQTHSRFVLSQKYKVLKKQKL